VALVEITSALVRRRAAGGITDEQLELALGILQRDRQHWTVLSLTEAVLKRAEEVVRHTVMRSLDALHVASAMGLQEELATALPFITADGMQEAGARRVGLEVLVVA
jgi:predicted nucleic acid-binding protein